MSFGNNPAADLSELIVAPVQGVVAIRNNSPDYVNPSAVGEKYIYFETYNSSAYLYTAISSDEWNNGVAVQVGERYASLTNHKIYQFRQGRYDGEIAADQFDIPVGVPFFNQADNCLYFFTGSGFVKITGT